MPKLTRHAGLRVQERAIPPIVIDWLLAYGQRTRAGHGAECVFFDKRSRQALSRDLGSWIYGRLESKFDTYAIVSPQDSIITTGHRRRRVKRR